MCGEEISLRYQNMRGDMTPKLIWKLPDVYELRTQYKNLTLVWNIVNKYGCRQ